MKILDIFLAEWSRSSSGAGGTWYLVSVPPSSGWGDPAMWSRTAPDGDLGEELVRREDWGTNG